MEFASRMNQLKSAIFSTQELLKRELIAEGREIFNFSVGTPDLPPPEHVMEVFSKESLKAENYHYAIKDSDEFICAAKQWYQERYNVSLESEEVLGLNGSQDALAHIAFTLVNPSDLVLIQDPYYPIFFVGPYIAESNIHFMPLLEQNNYLIDFKGISPSVAHAAKLMIVSYPNNPVTATAPYEFYEELVWFAKKYKIAIVHDNAYSELVFDGEKPKSFLSVPGAKEVGIELNSLSKSYNMPGCRISFALGNKAMLKELATLKSHIDYGIFIPVQKAAIAAITGPYSPVKKTVGAYESRRDLLVDSFNQMGWSMEKPKGTMFIWAKVPSGFDSSEHFCNELIRNTGVFTVPGSAFGDRGEGYVRLAMVQPEEKIQKALQSVKAWLSRC